jgi:hypothetical protein
VQKYISLIVEILDYPVKGVTKALSLVLKPLEFSVTGHAELDITEF